MSRHVHKGLHNRASVMQNATGCCPFARSLLDGGNANFWRAVPGPARLESRLDGTFWRFPCCEELGSSSGAHPSWLAWLAGRLVLVMGDSLAYEMALALMCSIERHTGMRPTLFGAEYLEASQNTQELAANWSSGTRRLNEAELVLIAQLWAGQTRTAGKGGARVLARYADGTTVVLGTPPANGSHVARWPQLLAASAWRAASVVLVGGGWPHLASHWACPQGYCPLPGCSLGYLTEGKRGWFDAADDPAVRGGRLGYQRGHPPPQGGALPPNVLPLAASCLAMAATAWHQRS